MSNAVVLKGNLGDTPEIKVTRDNKQFAVMSIAVSEEYYDKETKETRRLDPDWFRVAAFGILPLHEAKSLKKGALIRVEGKLRTTEWDDKNTGQKRYGVEIVASSIEEIVRRKPANEGVEGSDV